MLGRCGRRRLKPRLGAKQSISIGFNAAALLAPPVALRLRDVLAADGRHVFLPALERHRDEMGCDHHRIVAVLFDQPAGPAIYPTIRNHAGEHEPAPTAGQGGPLVIVRLGAASLLGGPLPRVIG